eukprot:GILI01031589.1.p2 GENE.GILI01031589.1~~GILI01031589.1.p2  ORF type:complete len:148 (-),score=24.92 GILI01031589.1:225-608(-)
MVMPHMLSPSVKLLEPPTKDYTCCVSVIDSTVSKILGSKRQCVWKQNTPGISTLNRKEGEREYCFSVPVNSHLLKFLPLENSKLPISCCGVTVSRTPLECPYECTPANTLAEALSPSVNAVDLRVEL